MLRSVRPEDGMDIDKIKEYLFVKNLIPNRQTTLNIQQYTNGYSNLTYLLETEQSAFVLRRPPIGAVKRGHDMSREYKVLDKLAAHWNKSPKTICYEDETSFLNSPFYLMEKVEGTVVNYKAAVDKALSTDDFKTISESWLETFITLHKLDYKAVGLADLGRPDGYVERQVSNWSKQYRKAATMEIAEADFVMKWMTDNQPTEYDHTLIHNDYKYDNLIYDETDYAQVRAVLDWEMCTLGDPLMDLGTSLGYWTLADDNPVFSKVMPSPTSLPGNPSRLDIVHAYSTQSGRAINDLVFYYVYGLFKIAVIVQQIYYRYDKGLTNNKKFAQLDKVCLLLCQTAKQAINKNKIQGLY